MIVLEEVKRYADNMMVEKNGKYDSLDDEVPLKTEIKF